MSPTPNYRKTYAELKQAASMLWPAELITQATEESIIPLLLDTQENVIGILNAGLTDLPSLLALINNSFVPNNLFVRHLMVLCDIGGENLSSYNDALANLIPDGELQFLWDGRIHAYRFRQLGKLDRLANTQLGVTAVQLHRHQSYKWPENLAEDNKYSALQKDVIVLLLFGSSATNKNLADKLQKCEVGKYLGHSQAKALNQFVRERYIWVSRQAGGAISNKLGALAEQTIANYLENRLHEELRTDIVVQRNGVIAGARDNEQGNLIKFDLVATKANRHVAIEVSFQETTNSVVERKRGQAQHRFEALEQTGNKLVYVIDGAGNFRRRRFMEILCHYSHCTVAFTQDELEVLYQFVTTTLTENT
jgi:hypothetical protein